MNILFVNTSDVAGGAAIAAQRLQHALQGEKIDVKFLVRDKKSDNNNIISLNSTFNKIKFVYERANILLRNRSLEDLWRIDTGHMGIDITKTKEFKEADLIHLHWINQAMLSIDDIEKILRSGKPVVWTMHDMWPFTGICHHAEQCERWKEECGECPQLQHPSPNDFSHKVFLKKQHAYQQGRIHFVACSNWLQNLATQSPLTDNHQVESIPNPIDTEFYSPGDKLRARRELGLPRDKKLLLFVAFKATDKNKGIDYLIDSTRIIAEELPDFASQLAIVPVGHEAELLKDSFACDCYPQGYVTDREHMLKLYHAADLLVMPTLMDNLPNTIVEAGATSLPCVGFRVGGLPQMIHEGENGFLAKYKSAEDFAHVVLNTLTSHYYTKFCENARRCAVKSYSEKAVAQRYLKLYKQCIEKDTTIHDPD